MGIQLVKSRVLQVEQRARWRTETMGKVFWLAVRVTREFPRRPERAWWLGKKVRKFTHQGRVFSISVLA